MYCLSHGDVLLYAVFSGAPPVCVTQTRLSGNSGRVLTVIVFESYVMHHEVLTCPDCHTVQSVLRFWSDMVLITLCLLDQGVTLWEWEAEGIAAGLCTLYANERWTNVS